MDDLLGLFFGVFLVFFVFGGGVGVVFFGFVVFDIILCVIFFGVFCVDG